jgi:YihY family inner membrane protein
MEVVSRIDGYQRRHRWLGMPLAVVYKFVDDQGSYLTALITYYGFLSLFPLLLLLVTGLGFLLQGNGQLQQKVLDSALAQFPVIGDQIGRNIHSLRGSGVAVVVGLLGGVYGALGVVQALQNALNKVWAVPRNSRPNPLKARLRSLLLLVVVIGALLLITVLSAITAATRNVHGILGFASGVAVTVLSVLLYAALFVAVFRVLTARPQGVREVLRGAVAAAVIWQVLQWAGSYYLVHQLRGASATYGLFGIVFGLLAWIYLAALTLVLCAEFNAVRAQRLWPRSLLTPFTDDVSLTGADRRAYESYAETERHKGFETVDVDFEQHPPAERH